MNDNGGCVALLGFLCVCFILFAVLFVVLPSLDDLANSHAAELRAQEGLERARSDREHQRSVDFENRYILLVTTLKSYENDVCLGAGAVVLAVLTFALGLALTGRLRI